MSNEAENEKYDKNEQTEKEQKSQQENDFHTDTRHSYQKKRVIVPSITAVIFIVAGIYFLIHSHFYQSTDDAFVEGHIVSVAPRVSGPVVELFVDDNKPVKKGDLLLTIDENDYAVKLAEARANLEKAKSDLKISQ